MKTISKMYKKHSQDQNKRVSPVSERRLTILWVSVFSVDLWEIGLLNYRGDISDSAAEYIQKMDSVYKERSRTTFCRAVFMIVSGFWSRLSRANDLSRIKGVITRFQRVSNYNRISEGVADDQAQMSLSDPFPLAKEWVSLTCRDMTVSMNSDL